MTNSRKTTSGSTGARCAGGFTLIEVLICTVLLISILAIVVYVMREGEAQKRKQQLLAEVAKVVDVVHTLYPTGSVNGYNGITNQKLAPLLSGTLDYDATQGNFVNAYGGTISVLQSSYQWDGVNEADRTVLIGIRMPKKACPEIAVDLRGIAVATAISTATSWIRAPGQGDADAATINDLCSVTSRVFRDGTSFVGIYIL